MRYEFEIYAETYEPVANVGAGVIRCRGDFGLKVACPRGPLVERVAGEAWPSDSKREYEITIC